MIHEEEVQSVIGISLMKMFFLSLKYFVLQHNVCLKWSQTSDEALITAEKNFWPKRPDFCIN